MISPYYRVNLRMIYNPPVILFYKGCTELFRQTEILTVVGTRNPSNYSIYVGEHLCYEIARQDVIIASGGALGLDSVAHHAAIRAGKPTIAVMGCGIDCDIRKATGNCVKKFWKKASW